MKNNLAVFILSLLWIYTEGSPNLFDWFAESEAVQIVEIRNDELTIVWKLPEDVENVTTTQRLVAMVMKTSTLLARSSISLTVDSKDRRYTFKGLVGNTTYRVSVEAFREDTSLWYGSNMGTTSLADLAWLAAPTELGLLDKTNDTLEISWIPPEVTTTGHNVMINQYLVTIYEFFPHSKSFSKKFSINVPIPKTTYLTQRLSPGSIYNFTIQAGTSYGYGNIAWAVFNTVPSNSEESFILKLKSKTPNSLTLTWPNNWMTTANAKFTIRARSLHSFDGIEKEILNSGFIENGRTNEFVLKNLNPGSTYNISMTTPSEIVKNGGKRGKQMEMKSTWAVYSTLIQGEYSISDARIVIQTESSASIVFQPLTVQGEVTYQIRYSSKEDNREAVVETKELDEADLRCPKFGCEWKCFLVFNLPKRPREYTFLVRAKVDGIWNKWTPIQKRPWNLLERACSINPPTSMVDHIGNEEYQRLIDLQTAPGRNHKDAWRFLVVVDSRYSEIASIDITKLADKTTADFDHVPYYIAGSLTPEQIDTNIDFRVGDGKVYGGYLNYPLMDTNTDPQWTLIPVGHQENEIMEPRLKICGFTEEGSFDCEMAFSEVFNYIPNWLKVVSSILFVIFLVLMLMFLVFCIRRCRAKKSETKETSLLYYHNDSPHHSIVTQEYRRVDLREFGPDERDERQQFMEYLE